MGFKIVKQARAWWPVEWPGVAEDGTIVTNRIEMQFMLLKVDVAAEWVADVIEAQKREEVKGADLAALYAGLIARVAANWRGVEAENGEPLVFDGEKWLAAIAEWQAAGTDKAVIPAPKEGGEALKQLMNEPGVFTHVFNAFRDCLGARTKVREGN